MQDWPLIIEAIRKLTDSQKQAFQFWLAVTLAERVAYYLILGLVSLKLGTRLIRAFTSTMRGGWNENS